MKITTLVTIGLISILCSYCDNLMIRRNIEIMRSNQVLFPESLCCIYGANDEHPSLQDSICKLVIYVDSLECTSCRLSHLYEYNSLSKAATSQGKFMLALIITPSREDCSSIQKEIKHRAYPFDVYVDELGTFMQLNSFIPSSIKYHAFLVNQSNYPIMIGDPTKGNKLNELFHSIIDVQ